jgi:hypothetical protein
LVSGGGAAASAAIRMVRRNLHVFSRTSERKVREREIHKEKMKKSVKKNKHILYYSAHLIITPRTRFRFIFAEAVVWLDRALGIGPCKLLPTPPAAMRAPYQIYLFFLIFIFVRLIFFLQVWA